MTATPITEKYHPIEQIAGLPAMNRVHDAQENKHEIYLGYVGQTAKFAFREIVGTAMLVELPTDAQYGDFLVLDGDTMKAARASGTVDGRVGVAMASVDSRVNDTTGKLYGWMVIEGRCVARLATGITDGTALTTDATAGNEGLGVTGGTDLGATAKSNTATAPATTGDPDTVPQYGIGFGEVYIKV